MIDLHLNHGNSHEGVYLRLPATPDEVGEAFSMLEELGEGKVTIFDVSCPIQNIYWHIIHTDINDKDNFSKLQKLAQDIDGMDRNERKIFSGALDAESINGLDDVLRIAGQLDHYAFIPGVTNNKELGGFLVESGYKDFPDHVRPYLDYAGIGAKYYAERGGAFTSEGYVHRREMVPEQTMQVEPVIRLWLYTQTGVGMILNLPATKEQLEAAKRALNVEEFAATQISKAEMHHYDDFISYREGRICVHCGNLELHPLLMYLADHERVEQFYIFPYPYRTEDHMAKYHRFAISKDGIAGAKAYREYVWDRMREVSQKSGISSALPKLEEEHPLG